MDFKKDIKKTDAMNENKLFIAPIYNNDLTTSA